MELRVRRDDPVAREEGFTLVEMVVTVTVIAALFLAVAVMLDSSLRALAAAKARARGNDVATAGIEDLQRYSFNSLGLCTPPSGTAPSGLESWVQLTNCATPDFENPCNDPTGNIPLAEYTCQRNNVSYQVKRYVAWADPLQTTKRLAVYVEWTDLAGNHQVSQQSSLRAPDQSAITGLTPPKFLSPAPSATPLTNGAVSSPARLLLEADGTPAAGQSVKFTARTSNLNKPATGSLVGTIPAHSPNQSFDITVSNGAAFPHYNGFSVSIDTESFRVVGGAGTDSWRVTATGTATHTNSPILFGGDRVYAVVQTIGDNGSPESKTVFLNPVGAGIEIADWEVTVPNALDPAANYRFGVGTQYVSFSILRAADGKTSSVFASNILESCPASTGTCAGVPAPTITTQVVPTGTVSITASGALVNDVALRVKTTNITSADTVTVSFLTQAGTLTVVLTPVSASTCPPTATTVDLPCEWVGTIARSAGYRFSSGTQPLYFAAQQVVDADPLTIDNGSTGVLVHNSVTFG